MSEKTVLGNANSVKSILRNVEVKVSKSDELVKRGDIRNLPRREVPCKYARPQINSTKKVIDEMEKWENMDYETHKKLKENKGIRDKDTEEINKKVANNVNCHLNERLYKDLIALNLEDKKQRSKSPSRRPISNFPKDIEPKMEDFCTERRESDKPIIVPPIKMKLKPVTVYDIGDIYRKVYS